MDEIPVSGKALLADAICGLTSPLDSLRFMRLKKSLLVMGLAPHLVAFIIYVVLAAKFIVPTVIGFLIEKQIVPVGWDGYWVLDALFWLFALTLFALLGPSIVNTFASPVFDIIAKRTYEYYSGKKLPPESVELILRSFLGECSKLALWLTVTIFLATVPFAAFIGGVVALWFLGWTHVDRTLNLQTLRLGERLKFGLRHAPACMTLGLWGVIPGISSIFTFLMASAGAVVVAKAEQRTNQ
jgi:hypothetical protein